MLKLHTAKLSSGIHLTISVGTYLVDDLLKEAYTSW